MRNNCITIQIKNIPIRFHRFLADRTDGRAYVTVLCLSVVCIVTKQCVIQLELYIFVILGIVYATRRFVNATFLLIHFKTEYR